MVERSLFLCVLCRCSTRCLSLDGCIACSWSCTRSSSVAFESFDASARSKIFTMALLQTWRFHDLIPWCQQKPAQGTVVAIRSPLWHMSLASLLSNFVIKYCRLFPIASIVSTSNCNSGRSEGRKKIPKYTTEKQYEKQTTPQQNGGVQHWLIVKHDSESK